MGEAGGGGLKWQLILNFVLLSGLIWTVDGQKWRCVEDPPPPGTPTLCVCMDYDWGKKILYQKQDIKCCDGPGDLADISTPFCQELLRDDDLAWTRPITGFRADGKPVHPSFFEHICGTTIPQQVWRMAPSFSPAVMLKNLTNRLQFNASWIAQEGISFCVVGGHYRRSPLSLWEPLKGFLPLAEKSFDIGNHIDPEDSTKMNFLVLPLEEELRSFPDLDKDLEKPRGPPPQTPGPGAGSHRPWGDKPVNPASKKSPRPVELPGYRFKNVWLGISSEGLSQYNLVNVPLHEGFKKRPAHKDWQPDPSCENPYRVSVTMIEADSILLHNYLHIKVHAEPKSQPANMNCPTGRIKLLMLEVRDQHGLPVGQFTDDVPCDQDEETTKQTLQCTNDDPANPTICRAHHGTKQNVMPCMFSHPKSNVHPTIFMMAADKFDNPNTPSGPPAPQDACRNNQKPDDQQKPEKISEDRKRNHDQYVTEVHATWRFAQMDEGWVSELHFSTMIIEDETPIQYYTSRLTIWDGLTYSQPAVFTQPWDPSSIPNHCPRPLTNTLKTCCWRVWWPFGLEEFRAGRLQLGLINSCVNATYNTNRPYGYSARYNAIFPTFKTRGGWDYFRKHVSPKYVNCHVNIAYSKDGYYDVDKPSSGKFSVLPIRKTLKDHLNDKYTLQVDDKNKYKPPVAEKRLYWTGGAKNFLNTYELPDWHNPGMTMHTDTSRPGGVIGKDNERFRFHAYLGLKPIVPILKMFDSAHQDPIVLTNEFDDKPYRDYFGSRYIAEKELTPTKEEIDLRNEKVDHDQEFTLEEMALNPESRCPCPFFPTTPPPELATKPPVEIEGRRTHVVNMLLAWVVLIPIAFFVARFFKETYSRVFFLQEFWWYTMHVLCLMTALLFTFGGIYALKIKRSQADPYEIVWTDATMVHIYGGYGLVGFFIFHLLIGPFRFHDVELRIIQIGLHWLFGWLEYVCAITVILSAAAIPSGIMNCITFGIYCGFLGFQLVFTLGMEVHMHRVDAELELDPPRAYMPPPMMRLFHRDAPHSFFRVVMLGIYVVCCFLFYVAMHISMTLEGAEFSCFQPTEDADAAHEV